MVRYYDSLSAQAYTRFGKYGQSEIKCTEESSLYQNFWLII